MLNDIDIKRVIKYETKNLIRSVGFFTVFFVFYLFINLYKSTLHFRLKEIMFFMVYGVFMFVFMFDYIKTIISLNNQSFEEYYYPVINKNINLNKTSKGRRVTYYYFYFNIDGDIKEINTSKYFYMNTEINQVILILKIYNKYKAYNLDFLN